MAGAPSSNVGVIEILLILLIILIIVAIIILVIRARRKGDKRETLVGFSAPVPGLEQQRLMTETYVKRCPTCKSTYTDETLAFCLSDGSTLERVASTSTSTDPNATLIYPEANRSNIPPTVKYHPEMPPNNKG
jgi:hypothetical protein